MKRARRGFTLVEVMLFLAITGLLFLGVTIGVQNSIYQQRFNDSTQGVAEFLRSAYASVANVQGIGDGRSGRAIYGKVVTFGEDEGKIYTYDVVGEADDIVGASGSTLELLRDSRANVVAPVKVRESGSTEYYEVGMAGMVDEYTPKWGAALQPACGEDGCNYNSSFVGTIMIVRHPRSGTIFTFVIKGEALKVREFVSAREGREYTIGQYEEEVGNALLLELLNRDESDSNSFKVEQVDLCVNPNGNGSVMDTRRDVRIIKSARNASGVEIINADGTENVCRS